MELEPTEEQQFFQETTRKFLETETPIATVRALGKTEDGFDRTWWKRGCELGWTSLLISEENGGGSLSGSGLEDLMIVAEEFGRHVAPGPLVSVNIVADTISRVGSAAQRDAVLPGIISGDIVATWAYRDGQSGWNAADVTMRATPADGGGYVLSGSKTAVECGAQADWLLVTARAPEGLTQFLIPTSTAGVNVTKSGAIDLVRRFARIDFDNVSVDGASVVGNAGAAADDVERQLQLAAVLQCGEIVGATGKVFEFTTEYAFDRFSFGRPLASYQALKHRFADMKLWLEASYGASLNAAKRLATGSPTAPKRVSATKAYIADRCPEIVQDCVQMHGGIGVTWEHDIHLYLRRVALQSGLFGNVDHHLERVAVATGL